MPEEPKFENPSFEEVSKELECPAPLVDDSRYSYPAGYDEYGYPAPHSFTWSYDSESWRAKPSEERVGKLMSGAPCTTEFSAADAKEAAKRLRERADNLAPAPTTAEQIAESLAGIEDRLDSLKQLVVEREEWDAYRVDEDEPLWEQVEIPEETKCPGFFSKLWARLHHGRQ